MSDKIKIVFTHTPEKHQGGDFEAGDVAAVNKASADRWIRRGVAMLEADYKEIKAAEKAEAKEKAGDKE